MYRVFFAWLVKERLLNRGMRAFTPPEERIWKHMCRLCNVQSSCVKKIFGRFYVYQNVEREAASLITGLSGTMLSLNILRKVMEKVDNDVRIMSP